MDIHIQQMIGLGLSFTDLKNCEQLLVASPEIINQKTGALAFRR